MIKRMLSMLLALTMVLSLLPTVGVTGDTVTLLNRLYVGGVAVISNGVVGKVTSGTGWHYDTTTATLYLTDGADIRYTNPEEEYLENGINGSGVLNIHASGTVSISGYGDGIAQRGDLNFYVEEGATVTISAERESADGIAATGSGVVTFSGKGTVNVNSASTGAARGICTTGDIKIDGITLNARGVGNYKDVEANNSILVGQTESAVVNCLGSTTGGIGSSMATKIGIFNGSTVHLTSKSSSKTWLVGMHADSIEIVDSCVVVDGLKGAGSIYALHGSTTVHGKSHILCRQMEAPGGNAYGLTTGSAGFELTALQDYYCRTSSDGEFAYNAEVMELWVSYFELYTSAHHSYHSNGDGTHYYGCPGTCLAAIKGTSEECSGTATCDSLAVCESCGISYGELAPHSTTAAEDEVATCSTLAYCSTCEKKYGTLDPDNHTTTEYKNGFRACCGEYQPAPSVEAVYQISNAGHLYWYAQYLNTENAEVYAELTNDLVIPENAPNWEPINASYVYFNGNSHTISGLKCIGGDRTYVGLFGLEGWWYEISNLHITDSYFEGKSYVGAVVACMSNGGHVTNCAVTNTTVKGNTDNVGGLIGSLSMGFARNCFSMATVIGAEGKVLIGSYTEGYSSIENCYFLGSEDDFDGTAAMTAQQFESGEVAYLLQSGIAGEEVWDEETQDWVTAEPDHIWGQTIGTDDYPALGGQKVYQKSNGTYSNVKDEPVAQVGSASYTTLQAAVDNADGEYVKLLTDVSEKITLNAMLFLDLNGFDLSGTVVTNGHAVYGIDSATDDYTCENMGVFSCVDEKGNAVVPEMLDQPEYGKWYLTVETENGYTFHSFYIGITHMTMNFASVGVGYKAVLRGDEMVLAKLADENSFAFRLQLEGNDPVYCYWDKEKLTSGAPISLRIRNYDVDSYSETPLFAQVCITLSDGTVVTSDEVALTFRWMVEEVNKSHTEYTTGQISSLKEILGQFTAPKAWDIPNLT